MTTAAIVLAAGASRRLGEPKQLLAHERGTLLENTIAAALDAECEPVIVVGGAVDLPLHPPLAERVTMTHNHEWARGMGGSIRCGVTKLLSLVPTVDRSLILVCDQPAISGKLLGDLLDHWQVSTRPMVACAYGGLLGPPCGFCRSEFDALLKLSPEQGAKSLLNESSRVAVFDWPPGSADIDTPDDLKRWRAS